MKRPVIPAFLRLIRWPNLVFIALAQALFYYSILLPGFFLDGLRQSNTLDERSFWLLCLSSVLIAAGGYIINDYFDLNIDRVNKPGDVVVEKVIPRRRAIAWHGVLSVAGIAIGTYLSVHLRNIFIGPCNLLCVLLLWFYSTTLKRKLLVGNVLISLLTAWVILVLYFAELRFYWLTHPYYHTALFRLYKFAILYAGFAFVISLIRECVKDIEDIDGDRRYGCRTLPIVWGVPIAKLFAGSWALVLAAGVLICQVYVLQYGWVLCVVYNLVFVLAPLIAAVRRLQRAETAQDYHALSSLIKGIMFTGILSMIFFKYYTSWQA